MNNIEDDAGLNDVPEGTPDFTTMTIAQLKEFAADYAIILTGAVKKADIITTITDELRKRIDENLFMGVPFQSRGSEKLHEEAKKLVLEAHQKFDNITLLINMIDGKDIDLEKKYRIYKILQTHLIKCVIMLTEMGVKLPQYQYPLELPEI